MWLAILLIGIIVLALASVLAGPTIWLLFPLVLLIVALAVLAVTGMLRSDRDRVARVESGPSGPRERPEDSPGGPEHAETGYAHRGQARMTP